MALATTCPQCQTSFKVVPDQLKLRRGLVRCGVCQHVFSGIDNLRYVNEPRTAQRPAVAPPTGESPDLKTAFFLPETVIGDQQAEPHQAGPASPMRAGPSREPPRIVGDEPPAQRKPDTGRHRRRRSDADGGRGGSEAHAEAGADANLDAGHGAAIRSGDDTPEAIADSLSGAFAPARSPASSGASQRRVAIAVGALAILLLLQLALGSRDLLAARVPAIRPLLSTLGAPLGLHIELPRLPGKVTIESFELAGAGPAGVYKLNALLRNRASHPIQWPAIELTLTDVFGSVVASRVLLPHEYLLGARADNGFAGNTEKSVALDIAIDEVVPSGYRAILFYP